MLNMNGLRSRVTLFVLPECGREIDRLRAEVGRLETALAEAHRAAEVLATYAPPPTVTKAPGKGRKPKGDTLMATEDFWRARSAAIARAGARWHLEPDSRWITIPTKWRTQKTERGTTLRWNQDQRMPAARHWDGREWPSGLVWQEPAPVTTDWDAIQANRDAAIADQIVADREWRAAEKARKAAEAEAESEMPEMEPEFFTSDIHEPEVETPDITSPTITPELCVREPLRPVREFAVPILAGARPVPDVWFSRVRCAVAPMLTEADLTDDELRETGD